MQLGISQERTHSQPITSREDRQRMDIPNKSCYNKWITKFQHETKPKSPKDFKKASLSIIFTNPKLNITSKPAPAGNSKIRKPSALTVDNHTYDAIDNGRPTRPVIATPHRKILLPPPPPPPRKREHGATGQPN